MESITNQDKVNNQDTTGKILEFVEQDKKELYVIIHKLESRLKESQNLLDQQQRLALQDKQLLQEYKAENDKLKSLKSPSEYPEDKPNQETPLKNLEFENKALKEELAEQKERREEELVQLRAELTQPKKWYEFWR